MASNYDILRDYFGTQAQGAGANDIANFILLNAKPKNLGGGKLGDDKPSVVGRIFDILSRPNYAIAEMTRKRIDTGDAGLSDFLAGLSGRSKTTFEDVLEEAGMEDRAARAGLGFVMDVALDPTTYIPVAGIAKALGKGGKAAQTAAKPLGQQLIDKGPAVPETFGRESVKIPEALKGSPQQTPVNTVDAQFDNFLATANSKNLSDEEFISTLDRLMDSAKKNPKSKYSSATSFSDILDTFKSKKSSGTVKPGEEGFLPVTDISPKPGAVTPGQAPVGQLQFPLLDITPTEAVAKAAPVEKAAKITGQQALKFPDLQVTKARAEAAEVQKFVEKLADRAPAQIAKLEAGDIMTAARMMPKPSPAVDPRHAKSAEQIVAKFIKGSKLDKANPDTLSAAQQVRLWNEARKVAARDTYKKGKKPADTEGNILDRTAAIYSAVEKSLTSQGLVPRIGTGENVRLIDVVADLMMRGKPVTDDVLKEFSTTIKPGSEAWKSVEILRARGAVQDAPVVKTIIDKATEASTAIKASGVLSNADNMQFDKFVKNFSKTAAKTANISPASQAAVAKLIDTTLRGGKSEAQLVLAAKSKMLDDVIAGGRKRAEINGITTKALEKNLGKLPAWAVNDNKGMEFLMGRVATWWGQSDLRPLSLAAIGSAHATAATRGKVLDELFAPFNDAQRHEAWKVIQGTAQASTSETAQLASRMSVLMDNLVGQVSGSSVLLRSAVDRDMLNKWMQEYRVGFTFKAGKAKTLTGDPVDYSKGTDWVNSWKTANVKEDPKLVMFKMQQAMEQATREKALFDEIGERFGSTIPGRGYKTKITGHPYLDEYYFPPEIAQQIPRVVKDWSPAQWKAKTPLVRHYDRVLSMVKSGLTIYRPGHHVRNYIGDVYLGWMDGVNTLRPYTLAMQVQKSMRGAYKDIQDVDDLVKLGAMPSSMGTPKPNQVLFKNKSGVPFTAEQIAAAAHQRGLLEHVKTLEDLLDMGSEGGKKGILDIQPFGGKVQAVARGTSELFSHNTRLAHFIDKVMKSRGSDLPKIFEGAANRSRKWHPTGLDLTDFEKRYMRRIIPFYSWMRKSTPLLIEGLVMNPGKTVIPAKAWDALQEAQGIDVPGRHDPFPVDQMFPEWIRNTGFGPIGVPDGLLGSFTNQEPPGYAIAGMGLNPLTDMITQLQSPGKAIASSLTPAIQMPVELISGRKIFTGQPITGPEAREGALPQWVGEQIPIFSALQGITGITPFGTETSRSKASGGDASREAFLNWATGLGIKGTGPYIRQGQYEFRQPGIAASREAKDEFLRRLRDANP